MSRVRANARKNNRNELETWSRVPHDLLGSVSSTAVNLFAALMAFAPNKAPFTCYPSQSALCRKVCGRNGPCSVKTIQRAQQELVAVRRLKVRRRKNKPNLYTLFPSKLPRVTGHPDQPATDVDVANGSDMDDRLQTTSLTDELDPPEPVLSTSLVSKELRGAILNACNFATRDLDRATRDAISVSNVYDTQSVLAAMESKDAGSVRIENFKDWLIVEAAKHADPPF